MDIKGGFGKYSISNKPHELNHVQCSPFIALSLGSIGMDHVVSEPPYTILQKEL